MPLIAIMPWSDLAANRPTSGDKAGRPFFASDTGVVSIWTGSAWEEISGSGGASEVRTSDAAAVTDTTLVSDTVLTANLGDSGVFTFRFLIFFNNAGAGEGFKCAVGGTVGVTSLKAQIYIYDDTLDSLVAFARVTALDSTVGAGLSSGVNYAIIEGTIETSTAGTFLLRYAQNAAGAGAGVTVQRNSSMVLGSGGGTFGVTDHAGLTGVTANQHHNQVHNLFSTDHPDVDSGDTPANNDILAFNGTDWIARPPNKPYLDVCVNTAGVNGGVTVDVNSTTYVAPGVMSFPLDASVINWTHFRIFIRGTGSGGNITAQLSTFAAPATPLSAGGDDLVITSGVTAHYDSGWIAFAAAPTTMQTLQIALKGAGATNDLALFNAHVMFKYEP